MLCRLFVQEKKLPGVTVQLTYYQVDTEETVRHRRLYGALELENFLYPHASPVHPVGQNGRRMARKRTESLKALRFPFAEYRAGQYRLAGAVYKTIAGGGRLFACAPTGVGKTISTLFPAAKALGEGRPGAFLPYGQNRNAHGGRGRGGPAARKPAGAVLEMRDADGQRQSLPPGRAPVHPQHCPRARGYYDRVNDALYRFFKRAQPLHARGHCGLLRGRGAVPV